MALITKPDLIKDRKEGLLILSSIKSLTVHKITTQEQYLEADVAVSVIRGKRQAWRERMKKLLDPAQETLKTAKAAKDAVEELIDEVDEPLMIAELKFKEEMRLYKLEEIRQIRAAEEAQAKEEARIQAEIKAKEVAAERACTAGMQAKILEQQAKLKQALADRRDATPPQPVKAEGSKARTVKKYRIVDEAAFMKYVSHSDELRSLLTVAAGQMLAKFRLDDPEVGSKWLVGVEVYEDINIAGR